MASRESFAERGEVRELIQRRADVNFQEGTPYLRTPLHLAVESGGSVDEVGHLLQARRTCLGPV